MSGDEGWTAGRIVSTAFKGGGALILLVLGYSAWKNPEVRSELARMIDGKAEISSVPTPSSAAAPAPAKSKPLEIEVGEDLAGACKLDPTEPICPLRVVRIANRGEPIQLKRIVINRRINEPECDIKLDTHLKLGDAWSSDLIHTETSKYVPYRYSTRCGEELVYVDLWTDQGSAEYSFKGGG